MPNAMLKLKDLDRTRLGCHGGRRFKALKNMRFHVTQPPPKPRSLNFDSKSTQTGWGNSSWLKLGGRVFKAYTITFQRPSGLVEHHLILLIQPDELFMTISSTGRKRLSEVVNNARFSIYNHISEYTAAHNKTSKR